MYRGLESGLPRGPRWLSAGLTICNITKGSLGNRQCCNLSFSYSHVIVYVLNSDNCCYLLSSFVLLDDVMTSFAFVYSSLLIIIFSKKYKILIKTLWESQGYGAKRLIKEFPDKNWNRRGLDYLLKKLREMGTVERTIGSGRRRSSRATQKIYAVKTSS